MTMDEWNKQKQASGHGQGQANAGAPNSSPAWENSDSANNNGNTNWTNGNNEVHQYQAADNAGWGNDANDNGGNNDWTNSANAGNTTWETPVNQNQGQTGNTSWGAEENTANTSKKQSSKRTRKDKTSGRNTEAVQQNTTASWDGSNKSPSTLCPTVTAPKSALPTYIKPYWSNWNAQTSSDAQADKNSRRRTEQIYIGPEEPLYLVPEKTARRTNTTHQVQAGRGAMYAHRVERPDYMDSLDKPYAVFTFKYRSKDVLEKMLGISIKEHPDDYKQRMMALSKETLVEELLKVKIRAGSTAGDEKDTDNGDSDEDNSGDESEDSDSSTENGGNNGGDTTWVAQNNESPNVAANSGGASWDNSGAGAAAGGDTSWNNSGGAGAGQCATW